MNKVKALGVVNPILFLSFVIQALTGLIMLLRIKVPNRPLVFEIHEYNGIFMVLLVATHLTLNWGWVKSTFFKRPA